MTAMLRVGEVGHPEGSEHLGMARRRGMARLSLLGPALCPANLWPVLTSNYS